MSKGVWNKTKEKLNSLYKIWSERETPLVSTQQIAKYINVDWHTAVKYLDKLESLGLVKRIEIKTKKRKITYWEKKKKLESKSARDRI